MSETQPAPGTILSPDAIPLVDLAFQHAEVAAEMAEALLDMIRRGKLAEGQAVAQFETDLAGFCHRRHCVTVANGVDALSLMLRAAQIGRGDEVIIPANGRLAMVAAVMRAGAWPVLADCDPVHHLLDPHDVQQRLTPRTRALVLIHLFGQMAPVEDFATMAAGGDVLLFEDAAQCLGGTRHGDPPGTKGVAFATSFHPGMSLGAFGGGGAVLTDDARLAARVRSLHERGDSADPERYRPGPPARFDASEAVVLAAKLRHLDGWNKLRRDTARLYGELLEGHRLIALPRVLPGNDHVWHRYVIRIPGRDVVMAELRSAGIGAAAHYAVPLHLLPASRSLGYRPGDFPHAETAADEMLSLPIYPGIRSDQVERVALLLRRTLRR